ncbi:hypothetical protein F5Y04DRAFT_63907 [Hypomontagnella monticulosa]|nr:hypothetical protein F5Y04DRAFT_63907 [Hypomontagnella monticulosa]
MINSRVSLLLLWSLWSAATIGLGSAVFSGYVIDDGDGKNREELGPSEWITVKGNEDGEAPYSRNRRGPPVPLPSNIRPQIPSVTNPPEDLPFLGIREKDAEDIIKNCAAYPKCSSFTNDISNNASATVASSLSVEFKKTSDNLQAQINTLQSPKPVDPPGTPVTVTTTTTQVQIQTTTASPSASATAPSSEFATPQPATITGLENPVTTSNTDARISEVIEEAKASASSSAQSEIDAANARACAATASANSTPVVVSSQGSNLTPGKIGGIVISIAFISSLLSALGTYLLMRRRERMQEPRGKLRSESPPDSGNQPLVGEPYGLPEGFSSARGLSGPEAVTSDGAVAFIPDVKQGLQPPPDTEHPAMSHAARPLSMPGPEGLDPSFPVSPLSSTGDESAGSGRLPSPVIVEPDPGEASGAQGPLMHNSDGIRTQVVRLGSRDGPDGGLLSPLAMHPPHAEPGSQYRYMSPDDVAGYAKEPNYAIPAEIARSPPPRVLSPTAKRPYIDPSSLERGPDY